jgi:hypothetical protein
VLFASGKCLADLNIESECTVAALKKLAAQSADLRADILHLISEGEILRDAATVGELKLPNGVMLQAILGRAAIGLYATDVIDQKWAQVSGKRRLIYAKQAFLCLRDTGLAELHHLEYVPMGKGYSLGTYSGTWNMDEFGRCGRIEMRTDHVEFVLMARPCLPARELRRCLRVDPWVENNFAFSQHGNGDLEQVSSELEQRCRFAKLRPGEHPGLFLVGAVEDGAEWDAEGQWPFARSSSLKPCGANQTKLVSCQCAIQ